MPLTDSKLGFKRRRNQNLFKALCERAPPERQFFFLKFRWHFREYFKNTELIKSIPFEVQIQIQKKPYVALEPYFALSLSELQSKVIYEFKIHK